VSAFAMQNIRWKSISTASTALTSSFRSLGVLEEEHLLQYGNRSGLLRDIQLALPRSNDHFARKLALGALSKICKATVKYHLTRIAQGIQTL
jgi:hypothetical protein